MHDNANTQRSHAKRWFLVLWTLVTLVKGVLAFHVPLFVDEAFYWLEGQHLAWAYSDLPGLTAWTTRLGVSIAHHPFALRLPFLLMAAALPWLVVRMTRALDTDQRAWQAGLLALLLPLATVLGVLALPDVPMTLATLLCLDAGVRLLRKVTWGAVVALAVGLMIGGLTHYRFGVVIAVGATVLLVIPHGRRLLRDWRVWLALLAGALAWLPLLWWNWQHADAGLRFQLVDRHPWAFHWDGWTFLPVQLAMVTPLLLVALLAAGWRRRRSDDPSVRFLALAGLGVVAFFFVLGFFADNERVSFHWPLPGYLALLPLVPVWLSNRSDWWRTAIRVFAGLGVVAMLGYYAVVGIPESRPLLLDTAISPAGFIDVTPVAAALERAKAGLPPSTRIIAGSFKIGAPLAFHLQQPNLPMLDDAMNRKHGRAVQLALWDMQAEAPIDGAAMLVIAEEDIKLLDRLDVYAGICKRYGPFAYAGDVALDDGVQIYKFLRFGDPAVRDCEAPAQGFFDAPSAGQSVPRQFTAKGWVVRDGGGVSTVEIALNGRAIAVARYGLPNPSLTTALPRLRDPHYPAVGFDAALDLSDVPAGRHWLSLQVRRDDGLPERIASIPIVLR